MLLLWTISGFALGWWANVLFGTRAPRRIEPRDDAEATTTVEVLQESHAGLTYKRVTQAGTPAVEVGQAEWRPLPIFAFALVALLILLLVIEPSWIVERSWLPGYFYAFKALLLSPGVLALLFGTVVGFLASRHREAIARRSDDFYQAFLGSEKKSSWALQSIVAIGALLLIVLAIEPDLLRHLESFKAGEVEAKFSSVSTTTARIKIITNDLSNIQTLSQWVNFDKDYLSGARANALDFDGSVVKEFRLQIRKTLFLDYVVPLARLLDCFENDNRLDRMRKSEGLIALAINLRSKVLQEIKDGSGAGFTERGWSGLLGLLDAQIERAVKVIDEEIPEKTVKADCPMVADIKAGLAERPLHRELAAIDLDGQVKWAVTRLHAVQNEKPFKLSFLDPYLICAVSDLVELTLGHTEKAAFLTQVKEFYPTDHDFIQPGIISLYYYLADSKQKSESSWTLKEKLSELDFAMGGADDMIEMSQKKAAGVRAGTTGRAAPSIRSVKDYDDIVDVYFTNKFVFLTQYLEIFCQHTLAGDVLPDVERGRWARFYKQMESALNTWELGPSLDLDDVKGTSGTASDLSKWAKAKPEEEIPKERRFDSWVAMAQSAVMLTERNNRASAQACVAGRFYLRQANTLLPTIFNETSAAARLRGYIFQIEERLKASCPSDR